MCCSFDAATISLNAAAFKFLEELHAANQFLMSIGEYFIGEHRIVDVSHPPHQDSERPISLLNHFYEFGADLRVTQPVSGGHKYIGRRRLSRVAASRGMLDATDGVARCKQCLEDAVFDQLGFTREGMPSSSIFEKPVMR